MPPSSQSLAPFICVLPPCSLVIHWALSLYTFWQTNTHNLAIPHTHISLYGRTALLKHFEICRAWQHRFNHRPVIQSQSNINSTMNSGLDLLWLQTMYYTHKWVAQTMYYTHVSSTVFCFFFSFLFANLVMKSGVRLEWTGRRESWSSTNLTQTKEERRALWSM